MLELPACWDCLPTSLCLYTYASLCKIAFGRLHRYAHTRARAPRARPRVSAVPQPAPAPAHAPQAFRLPHGHASLRPSRSSRPPPWADRQVILWSLHAVQGCRYQRVLLVRETRLLRNSVIKTTLLCLRNGLPRGTTRSKGAGTKVPTATRSVCQSLLRAAGPRPGPFLPLAD